MKKSLSAGEVSRSLFILRHGKSDWGAAYGDDHDRPLKPRGRKAAERMGRLLTAAGHAPDLVLASSAVRAHTTAEIAYKAGEWACPIEITRELYAASSASVLSRLQKIPSGTQRVLIVGHEPTCSELIGILSASRPPVFPTAALARIDLPPTGWDQLTPGAGRLAWLIPPRAFVE